MDNPSWAKEERFATHVGRKKHEDELDQKVAAWSSQFTPQELVARLQAAGIRSGVINTMKDIYSDPQLTHREQWVELEHPEIGKMHYQRPPFILTKSRSGPSRRDPLLGEHNATFYKELLGMAEREYQALVEEGVID
jgi:crotonobetainyl-CoA:carnitine CoA-transferase CaiB-like acyl-CoA transferase